MLVSILSVGCGPKGIKVDPEFLPYYQRFIDNGKKHEIDLSHTPVEVKFVQSLEAKSPGTVRFGVCYYKSNKIEINHSTWGGLDPIRKEALIAHELGHCLLKRQHDDSTDLITGKKLSIMHKFLVYSFEYANKYSYYMEELFVGKKNLNLFSEENSFFSYVSPDNSQISGQIRLEATEEVAKTLIQENELHDHEDDEKIFD